MAAVGGRALLPHSVHDLLVLCCTEAEKSEGQGHALLDQINFLQALRS